MKKYFKRLLLAVINKSYCDCNKYGVLTKENLNPDFYETIQKIESKLNRNR